MERSQTDFIIKDLDKKLVFLVGPRQVGKTWLAKQISARYAKPISLNYDNILDRETITKQKWPLSADLLILDEIHKMDAWKNFVKGVFDTRPESMRILVTGSARLDAMRQHGDSMAGRFFAHRLLPFSLKELQGTEHAGDLDRLLERGGFPEPFLAPGALDADRWRSQYLDRLLSQDILDTDSIRNLKAIRTLIELLRQRVGSPVSYTSLAGDLAVAPATVIRYVNLLEALFIVFRVTPYAHNIARSILKEPKIYFYDWGLVPATAGGPRLENLVAVSLLKHVFALNDYRGEPWGLHYLRNKNGAEADFCLVRDNRITEAVEIKAGDEKIGNGLRYFCRRYSLNGVQAVLNLRQERREGDISVKPLMDFLLNLTL